MELVLIPTAENNKQIREIWESLEAGVNTSYFLSWGWIENWINSLPDQAKPELAVFMEGNEPLLAFFVGKANLARKHFFKSRGWFVNATGIPAFDRVYIEYNGFVGKQPGAFRLIDILNSLPTSWDEFYLPGFDPRVFPEALSPGDIAPYRAVVSDDLLSPYVDLEMVRARSGDYLSLLSANTRAQINRSCRWCEKTAAVQLEVAHDLASALDIYNELVYWHEKTWKERKKEGAFSSDYLFQFHEHLIRNRFEYEEIQLLRIKGNDNTIGCLYNFVYKKNVYFYQSGINYNLDRRLKPGFVAHVEAIKHNAAAGHKTYDFLCGDSRYKMSLATHHNRLIWLKMQKPLIRFRIENALRKLKHWRK